MKGLERLLLEHELHQALIAYARLCDGRNWALMDNIFSADVTAIYGDRALPDYAAILAMLRDNLGGCGPTQHLLDNLQVWMEDEQVTSRIEVRASHRGVGENKGLTYDCIGHYQDRWTCTDNGWRIAHRAMVVTLEFGSRKLLGPAPSANQGVQG